jgi:hypothetical protein
LRRCELSDEKGPKKMQARGKEKIGRSIHFSMTISMTKPWQSKPNRLNHSVIIRKIFLAKKISTYIGAL